jgi:dynein heavy chain, axonemal
MKTNKTPLDIIKYIMDAVVVLFGAKLVPITIVDRVFNRKEGKVVQFLQESWDEAGKAVLSDMKFLASLKEYRKDDINEETIELLEPYLMQQSDWFNEKTAINASKAAAGIFRWSVAINEYHCKSKIVKPKREFLLIQQGRLDVALRELA